FFTEKLPADHFLTNQTTSMWPAGRFFRRKVACRPLPHKPNYFDVQAASRTSQLLRCGLQTAFFAEKLPTGHFRTNQTTSMWPAGRFFHRKVACRPLARNILGR